MPGTLLKMTTFSRSSRQFLWAGDGDASDPLNNTEAEYVVVSGLYDQAYRLDSSLTGAELKPVLPYTQDSISINADGIDVVTLSSVPEGTKMTVLSQTEKENGGVILFSTDLAGNYLLNLSHPLYTSADVEVFAV